MHEHFDAIVIGAGQAGPSLAVRLAKSGRKTALIERKLIGGTCVNNGCIPTKTLIASARAAHVARRGGDFGVRIDVPVRVDMTQVKQRKDSEVRDSVNRLQSWLGGTTGLALIHGHARFQSPTTLQVGERRLQAAQFFINVGARASVPDMTGLAEVPYLTNSSIMHVDFLPEHLLIVGGSYIGLEFAQMYRRFGSRVTVIEMGPRLIAREDDDVSAAIREILEAEGIAFRLNAKCLALRRRDAGVVLDLSCEEEPRQVAGSHVLLAVGRVPNTDDLGLEMAGVATDPRGYITVDDQLRTNVPGIWALGDANGRGAFTHTSYNDYEIVAANVLDGRLRRVTDRITTYALFIDPPLGRAGMTER
jgi:pyruvate/2-oxoglutarate dehydrogenase complex dihydrolipoamide dehydrogenase (E3) component